MSEEKVDKRKINRKKNNKLSIYVPDEIEKRLRAESIRQHRPISFLLVHAWVLSEAKIKSEMPTIMLPPETLR